MKKNIKKLLCFVLLLAMLLSGNAAANTVGGIARADNVGASETVGSGLEYYLQGMTNYGLDGNAMYDIQNTTVPLQGVTLPVNQSTISRRFNNSNNDSNPTKVTADTSGKSWGRYYSSAVNHWYYEADANGRSDTDPFSTILGAANGTVGDIIFKFEVDDTTTDFNVVIGSNAARVGGHWGGAATQSADIFVNAEETPRESFYDFSYNHLILLDEVKAVDEVLNYVDGTTATRPVITLTLKKMSGRNAPAISFITVSRADAATPVILAPVGSAIADAVVVDINDALPSDIEVWTTAGKMPATIAYTDTTEYDNNANRYIGSKVKVKGTVTFAGDVRENVELNVEFTGQGSAGTDINQEYFVDLGNATVNIPVDGVDLPANQSRAWRYLNAPGGEPEKDFITNRYWGVYYGEGMGAGYYATSGAGKTPYDSMIFATAGEKSLIFKFELKDSTTEYDVVIGHYNSTGAANTRAGAVYVNSSDTAAATFINQSEKNAVVLHDVTAAAEDEDTGLANILTLTVAKYVNGEPVINFISIREKGKPAVYLSDCVSFTAVTLSGELPETVDVLTTSGIVNTAIDYTNEADFNNADKKYILNSVKVNGDVEISGTSHNITVTVSYIIENDVHYYIDSTVTTGEAIYLQKTAMYIFNAMKNANPDMLNDVPDAETDGTGWGSITTDCRVYADFAYGANPYQSIRTHEIKGSDGYYRVKYNLPNLPVGEYLIQVGTYDPWGPRSTNIDINGALAGQLYTRTGKDANTSFLFKQTTANAALTLDFYGTDGPLVGFIIVRAINPDATVKSISFNNSTPKFFYRQGDTLDIANLSIVVEMSDYTYVMPVEASMFSGFDSSVLGEKTVTVNYMGKTLSYKVNVLARITENTVEEPDTGVKLWAVITASSVAFVLAAGAVCIVLFMGKKKATAAKG